MSTLQIYENNKHLNMQTQSLVCYNARQISHEGQAIKKLLGKKNKNRNTKQRDTFSYSKNSPYTMYTESKTVAVSYRQDMYAMQLNFSFYFEHANDPKALLKAFDFSDHHIQVSSNCSQGLNTGMVASNGVSCAQFAAEGFIYNGVVQHIPIYAIPRMIDKTVYPDISAIDNTITINDNDYCRYTDSKGNTFLCTMRDGLLSRAYSESVIEEAAWKDSGYKTGLRDTKQLNDVITFINGLSKGARYHSFDVKAVCENLNIKPGFFSIEIGGEKRNFYYDESTGKIKDVLEQ